MKWYQKPGWIVALIILFFPVGLYLMWRYTNWNKVAKIVITVFIAIIAIASFGQNDDAKQSSETTTVSSTIIQTTIAPTTVKTTTALTTKASETTKVTTAKATTLETTAKSTEPAVQIKLISITSPINAGNNATVKIQGKPNTEYGISVFYTSGKSDADGLTVKKTDSQGYVSWTWLVGAKTKPGDFHLTIYGDDQNLSVDFTVK